MDWVGECWFQVHGMLSHVQAWRSCYFWVFSLWVNSRKECIILGFGQAWTPTSTDPWIPSPKKRVEAWSFRKYSEWSSFPGVGCLPSAVRQYGLFPPLSSSYSSSALTSMFHCLSCMYYPWFRCRAFSCSWGWLWSTCLVHFAWWITVWMPLWSNANLSFPESGFSAMYIKVRPMTGGDPATITVSKLTTIQELRVGSEYLTWNRNGWYP